MLHLSTLSSRKAFVLVHECIFMAAHGLAEPVYRVCVLNYSTTGDMAPCYHNAPLGAWHYSCHTVSMPDKVWKDKQTGIQEVHTPQMPLILHPRPPLLQVEGSDTFGNNTW